MGDNSKVPEVKQNTRRIWGWVLIAIGGLVSLCDLYYVNRIYNLFFVLAPQYGTTESYPGFYQDYFQNTWIEIFMPVLLLGGSLITLGYVIARKEISPLSRGWVYLILGAINIVAFLIGFGLLVGNKIPVIGISLICMYPFLILGIIFLFYGIRKIRKEKSSAADPVDPGNLTA